MMLLLAVFEAEAVVFEAEAVGGRGPKNQSLGGGFTCFSIFTPNVWGNDPVPVSINFIQLEGFTSYTPEIEQFAPKKFCNPNSETIVFQSSIFPGAKCSISGGVDPLVAASNILENTNNNSWEIRGIPRD